MEAPQPGRSIDIELSGQEIITVDLDNLDADPDDVLDLLKESQSGVWVWTKLAGEYWRKGLLDTAERLAQAAVESFQANGMTASLPPIYSLLANIQLERARKAPKIILPDARQDDMRKEKPRDEYYREAAQYLNQGERAVAESGEGMGTTLSFLTRAILQLGNRSMDDALRSFDGVLAQKPTNVVALLGKARILYTRRQYSQALKLFQEVLRLNPRCQPDPRIGIGLCLWAMDHKAKAKAAWQRSFQVNPSEWASQLLLGLEAMNSSKNENQSEESRRQEFILGTKMIEQAFRSNQRNSAAANALCELFLRKGQYNRALKLAERTIQFADTLTVLTDGYIRAGRILHSEDAIGDAMKHYSTAKEGQPANVLASIGLAQVQLQNDETAGAIHTLDTLLQQPSAKTSAEATTMLASLRAHPRPGVSSSDQAQEKIRARELFDRVAKSLCLPEDLHANLNGASTSLTSSNRRTAADPELHIEIARLWQDDNLEKVQRALQEALRLSQAGGQVDPRLVNNIGVLHHLEGRFEQARAMYETAITDATGSEGDTKEGMSATMLYNLARVYEDQGETQMAKDAYEKLLLRHPEYVDAKVRQAQMLVDINRTNEAHELLKQALASQNSNLNLRAYYTHFLIQSNLHKPVKELVFSSLKDHDKHDIYSLCAAGWIQYHQARESRDPKAIEERKRGFQRSAEFYEKALFLDPLCAVAAQGLAIVVAEDALGNLGGGLGPPAPDENQKRVKNAREALDIFARVRESLQDGSVYANMGHCYYACDEFDRAIESYETASKRFYANHNVAVLQCLCRAWYAKANKDQSFNAMGTALQYAQSALHLHPHEKAIMYNIAMIEQKAAEMLLTIAPAKRSLKDLEKAIEQAAHAQKLFGSLASDPSPMVPYNKEIADQRRKYGESVLRRCDEHLATQRQHEAETQARIDAARQRRQDEKNKQEALERERMEQLRIQAEQLAEQRRIAREQAIEWTREVKMESDDERERKEKKKSSRKVKPEGVGSGDENVVPTNGESKKKRRGKLKKANGGGDSGDEDGALFSDEDEGGGDKPSKKSRSKKRVVRDDDEEESAAPRRKQIKSKEYISDSDEDMA
ncbi:RNA polymerase II-associated protein [Abortiporus biennis]|nr:RNA polymerase II-associated protein [Abortiporus biennis]